jgi:TatD DNase family protein
MSDGGPDPATVRVVTEEPATVGPWIDNHCHLDRPGRGTDGSPDAPDPQQLVHEARAAGVVAMITVGTDPATSLAGRALADSIDGVWATAGVHPHEATQGRC